MRDDRPEHPGLPGGGHMPPAQDTPPTSEHAPHPSKVLCGAAHRRWLLLTGRGRLPSPEPAYMLLDQLAEDGNEGVRVRRAERLQD